MVRYKSQLAAERRFQRDASTLRVIRWIMLAGALLLGCLGLSSLATGDFNGAWLVPGAVLWAMTPRWIARRRRRPHWLELAVYREDGNVAAEKDSSTAEAEGCRSPRGRP